MIYAGYNSLYKIENGGFSRVSQNFGARIDVLEIDSYDNTLMYLAVNDRLYRSEDAGVTFTTASFYAA